MRVEDMVEMFNRNFACIEWPGLGIDEESYLASLASLPSDPQSVYMLWLNLIQRRLQMNSALAKPNIEKVHALSPVDGTTEPRQFRSRIDHSFTFSISTKRRR